MGNCFSDFLRPNFFDLTELDEELSRYDYLIKVVIVGDNKVGKTALRGNYVNTIRPGSPPLSDGYIPTMCLDFCTKETICDGKSTKVQFWEISGAKDENMRKIQRSTFTSKSGCILTYDITSMETFNNINSYWLPFAKEGNILPNCNLLLLATNLDRESERQVPYEKAKAYADSIGASFAEISNQEASADMKSKANSTLQQFYDFSLARNREYWDAVPNGSTAS